MEAFRDVPPMLIIALLTATFYLIVAIVSLITKREEVNKRISLLEGEKQRVEIENQRLHSVIIKLQEDARIARVERLEKIVAEDSRHAMDAKRASSRLSQMLALQAFISIYSTIGKPSQEFSNEYRCKAENLLFEIEEKLFLIDVEIDENLSLFEARSNLNHYLVLMEQALSASQNYNSFVSYNHQTVVNKNSGVSFVMEMQKNMQEINRNVNVIARRVLETKTKIRESLLNSDTRQNQEL